MYRAIVMVGGANSVIVEGETPAALGTAIGAAISEDFLGDMVDVVFEVTGPSTRRVSPIIPVIPTAPTFLDNVITIPTKVGIDYKVGSDTVTGTITLTELVPEKVIVAVPKAGYGILPGVTKTWTFGYEAVIISVTPTAPTFLDNVITIPTEVGIDYKVGSDTVTGTITLTDIISEKVIVAVPKAGYTIPDGTIKTWTFEYVDGGE